MALDPGEAGADGHGHGLRQHRLADAGHVVDEEVPGGQHGRRCCDDRGRGAEDDGVQVHLEWAARLEGVVERRVDGGVSRRGHRLSRTTPHAERAYCHFRHLSFQLFTAPPGAGGSAGALPPHDQARDNTEAIRAGALRLRDGTPRPAAGVSSSRCRQKLRPEHFACQAKGFLGRRSVKRLEHRLGKSSRDGIRNVDSFVTIIHRNT